MDDPSPFTPRPPAVRYYLRATPHLADHAEEYRRDRRHPPADPLGVRGLPETRRKLNQFLLHLCDRLIGAGGRFRKGARLVANLHLDDARALRLLVAYGHVHHHLAQIVGMAGHGYCWGPLAPKGLYATVAGQARRMGRCHLFLAALYGRGGPAAELIQLMFPFAAEAGPGTAGGDHLHALLATHGVGPEQLADAMIQGLRDAPGGPEILGRLARRHRDVFLPVDVVAHIRTNLKAALGALPPSARPQPASAL